MRTQDVHCRQCNRPEETMEGTFYPPPVAAIKGFESNLRLYRKKEKPGALVQFSILLSFVTSAFFQYKV